MASLFFFVFFLFPSPREVQQEEEEEEEAATSDGKGPREPSTGVFWAGVGMGGWVGGSRR